MLDRHRQSSLFEVQSSSKSARHAQFSTMAQHFADSLVVRTKLSIGLAAWRLGFALVAVLLFLSSCADCFLVIQGRLTECGTTAPIGGATVTTMIDQGLHGAHPLSGGFSTTSTGSFKVTTNGTEFCDSWATLTFQKAGFTPLSVQFKGSTKVPAELCMTPSAGP